MNQFYDNIVNTLSDVNKQEDKLQEICNVIAKRISEGNIFHVIGTGHSHMVGEEFYARAGGLACVNMIAPLELILSSHPSKSTMIERISDYAGVVIMSSKLVKGDVIMICSNSGRNGLPVELAIRCKELGIITIAFTSLQHSKEVTSRHPSKKNLYQVCDYVIDNCGMPGDAVINIDGVKGKMGASSSIVGTYVAQVMGMMIAKELVTLGIEPPVFISSNLDAGDTWNEDIMKKYYNI